MSVGAVAVRHDPSSAAVVRRSIASELVELGVRSDCIDDVVLVASELVGNAILHAAAPGDGLEVGWDVTDSYLVLFVEDGSSAMPKPRSAGTDENSGRGLAIVGAIAQDWGVDRTSTGKRVWARVPLAFG